MSKNYMTMVGTVGTGIGFPATAARAEAACGTRRRSSPSFPSAESQIIFAGAHDGIYRSDDGGITFEPIASPLSGKAIWSVAFDPVQPDTIFAGWRRDGGQKVGTAQCPVCPRVPQCTLPPRAHDGG